MRKAILIILMALVLVIPAYATEGKAATDQPIQQEQEQDKEPVVVATLEELQAAIDAAKDGDTIYISSTISIHGNLQTDKSITIKRQEGFSSGSIFQLFDNALLNGFCIEDIPNSDHAVYMCTTQNGMAYIQNCTFIGDDNNFKSFIYNEISNVSVSNCSFIRNGWIAVECDSRSTGRFENCIFRENKSGAISNINGVIELYDCIIADNFSYSDGAINSCGKATLTNCQIKNNLRYGEKIGLDIFSYFDGELTIINENDLDGYFYQCLTGEKIEVPLIDYSDDAMLVFLTEEQAAEYFAPEPGDTDNSEDTSPEQSQPPQEPTQPPQGGSGDDTPSQPPEQPTEPPQDDTPDNPADTTPNTPQPPQKPSDGDNSEDDDYTPPIDYRPSQHPTRPSISTKPTEDSKPQEQPVAAKPQLACNGAVIDTSRTVILLGYGDGLLHEDDPLTRAQLATIIYRLLDDESIVKYSNTELAFADVAADAWYAPYVNVIQAAGIVNGVGNGRYDPNGKVTWSQILAILSRFVEHKEYTFQHIQYSGWAEQAIQTTVANGWIEDSADFKPDAVISRGELVQLINDVLALYR